MAKISKKVPQKKPPVKSSTKTANRNQKGGYPILVIVIMALLIVIVIMAINQHPQETKKEVVKETQVVIPKDKPKEIIKEEPKKVPEKKPEEVKKIEEVVKKPVEVPKEIPKPKEEINARIFFMKLNERTETLYVTSVNRKVKEDNKYAAVINELIKGMSAQEESAGYLSAFRRNIKLNEVQLKNRILWCDFNSEFEKNAAGGIMLNRLDQLIYTATQFPEVDGVILTINGVRKSSIGSDGISVSGVLRR